MIAPSAPPGSRRQARMPVSSREAEAGHLPNRRQCVIVQHRYLRPDQGSDLAVIGLLIDSEEPLLLFFHTAARSPFLLPGME